MKLLSKQDGEDDVSGTVFKNTYQRVRAGTLGTNRRGNIRERCKEYV